MSYSHKDEGFRNELETHLSMLQREGLVSTWHDRKILPGDQFGKEIDENLESSDIILLLVSPYFLASDYCYDIEMKRALERFENGEARVLPIILEHCDWEISPFGKNLLALPEDGKPITEYANQHKAFAEIARAIRRIIEDSREKSQASASGSSKISSKETFSTDIIDPQRSSNLGVKKRFSDKEKDDFLKEGFQYILKYFKNSLEELKNRNSFIDYDLDVVNSKTFTVKLYSEENLANECKIWHGADFTSSETIKYSNSINSVNAFNGMFNVSDDGYRQFFVSSGITELYTRQRIDKNLSAKGVAEILWGNLIEPLQR